MNAIKKVLENKYVAWLNKTVINLFTKYEFTLVDMIIFVLACTAQSWWMMAFYIIWIFVISPSLVALKNTLTNSKKTMMNTHNFNN